MHDPPIDEIRRIRHEISKEIGTNLDDLVERYSEMESRFSKPAVTQPKRQTESCIEAGK